VTVLTEVVLAAILGYLVGSIPFGYVVGRLYGVDVRQYGSGRTGGTNVWRAAGLPAALITVLGDGLKGVVIVLLVHSMWGNEWASSVAGAMAVAGHNWPVWLRFRGGAGGVTGAATLAAVNWVVALIVIPMAVMNLFLTRYASLGTLSVGVGGFVALLALWLWHPDLVPLAHVSYGFLTALGIVLALRPNLRRLLAGEERRITLW